MRCLAIGRSKRIAQLARACVDAGVRRSVQISALGLPADGAFIASKHRFDEALAALPLSAVALRPSVVYSATGSYGGMSMLRALAALPFGTGLGIAFFLWMAHRRGDAREIAATAGTVVIADACFTAPAVIVQFASGLWLAQMAGMPLSMFWLKTALILFFVIGACWLPVLRLQLRARDLARAAAATGAPLPPVYFRVMRWWFWLGWPAFLSVLAIFWLMVKKPM